MNLTHQSEKSSVSIIDLKVLENTIGIKTGNSHFKMSKGYDAYDACHDRVTTEQILGAVAPLMKSNEEKPLKMKGSQVDQCLTLFDGVELFIDKELVGYCLPLKMGQSRLMPIRSNEVVRLIRQQYYKTFSRAISTSTVNEVALTLDAKASTLGKLIDVHSRVANLRDKIYFDIGTQSGEVVEVTLDGWRILKNASTMFAFKQGMDLLIQPEQGGDLALLKKHLGKNLSEEDFKLVLGWLLGALRGLAPFPILLVSGQQGSGKSTFCKMLRRLVDPSHCPLSQMQLNDRNLAVLAGSSYLLCIDNVTNITQSVSDLMCMVSTGGYYQTRKLHTDLEQVSIPLASPLIMNGISYIPQFPDLLERCLMIELQSIDAKQRQTERELMDEFDKDCPRIMGFLYDSLANSMRLVSKVSMPEMPRMADFCKFVTACEPCWGWEAGSFFNCMNQNQNDLVDSSVDDNPFLLAIEHFVQSEPGGTWIGSSTELLKSLGSSLDLRRYLDSSDWPKSATQAGKQLRRLIPVLARRGFRVVQARTRDKERKRNWVIESVER